MKADTTRSTFKRTKHYNAVLMQQGRVQLDADWNEQLDITGHRIETETVDVIGECGAPMQCAGFHIVAKVSDLNPLEKNLPENQNPPVPAAGDLLISGGRYYVDGILCENDQITTYGTQPDFPEPPDINSDGTYLAYLDVWLRHITSIEDESIREVALGGPDTATRSKTLWQVKFFRLSEADADANCATALKSWSAQIAAGTGKLAARTATSAPSNDPCIVAPGAGYRRLENQHYRVEVHEKGNLGNATFKCSRDNGSIVSRWESQIANELTVSNGGRDKVLSFASGQWVELIDDTRELNGTPGTLVQLVKAEGNVLTIDPTTKVPAGSSTTLADFPLNPRIRRWDMAAVLKPANQNWLDLEDGVQVHFTTGTYKTGDYWLIPARTVGADVEWPKDPGTGDPLTQLPSGIQHHYCRLAVARKNGPKWTITDCRNIFPPLTELISFFYVGGTGQEPDLTKAKPLELTLPLEVGVTKGKWPVAGARVEFTVLMGPNGKLDGVAAPKTTFSDANGIASCIWTLDPNVAVPTQQVQAVLRDDAGKAICLPVHFNANLSIASQVAYNPANCAELSAAKVTNVQDAIDHLCDVNRGGGCDVTVGKGGEFATLDEALKKLLAKDRTDICICLMPDSDENLTLPQGLEIRAPSTQKKPVHVTISGCGPGSRIRVGEKPVSVGPLASFTLRNLSMATERAGSLIQCREVGSVIIENCHLYAYSAALGLRPGLLMIQGSSFIRLSNNSMSALYEGPDPFTRFKLIRMGNPEIFSAQPTATLAHEMAAALTKATPDVRQEFIKPYMDFARAGSPMPDIERRAMQTAFRVIAETGGQPPAGGAVSIEAVMAIYHGLAVILMDANADTIIENNRITGRIMLHGNGDWLLPDEWKAFAKRIQLGGTVLTDLRATLQIKNNWMTGIFLDRSVAQPPAKEKLAGMFSRLLLAENSSYSNIQLVAASLNISSNHFNADYEFSIEAGTVAARAAMIVGNSAPNPLSQLLVAVPKSAVTPPPPIPPFQQAANFLDVRPLP